MLKLTRPLFSAIGKELIVAFVILCANLALVTAAAALNNAYTLVRDSDGTVPKKDAVVIITFKGGNSGTLSMSAVQPGETVTDTGRFSVSGERITIQFKEMEWAADRQQYYLEGCNLILPFKALGGSEGPGTSLWTRNSADCKGKASPAKDAPIMAQLQTMAADMNNQQQADVSDQKDDNTLPPGMTDIPTTERPDQGKESCMDCKWYRCIKQQIALKEAFVNMYNEIAEQYAKLYRAKNEKGEEVPAEAIEDFAAAETPYVTDKDGKQQKVDTDALKKAGMEYYKRMGKLMETVRMRSEDVKGKNKCPACPLDSLIGEQISTNQSNCTSDANEYKKFAAAVPCRELAEIALQHEGYHSQRCDERKKENKLLTPYGFSLEEATAHELELELLVELLNEIKKAPKGCWRCGKTKEIYFDAAECNRKCEDVKLGGNLVFKCFKLNEKGEHIMGIDNQF